MKLILAHPRGFCAGVKRAIQTVEKALQIYGAPIYVRHEIVHNRHVVDSLKEKGAIFVEDLKEVPKGSVVIFSAHGVSPAVVQEAERLGLKAIDGTCPLVTKVHAAAKRQASKGDKICLIGHKKHVEVQGILGEAPERIFVIETVNDVADLPFSKNDAVFYLSQTTLSIFEIEKIVSEIKTKFPQAKTLPTSSICYATTNRQKALLNIAQKADLIIVVGDPKSSNSNRLREVGEQQGCHSIMVNRYEEILPSYLEGVKVIGLTAGASTPESVVTGCVEYLKRLGVDHVHEDFEQEEKMIFSLPDFP